MLETLTGLKKTRKYREVHVEALGETVRVRSLTGGELLECQEAFAKSREDGVFVTIQKSVVNADGDAWITDDDRASLMSADGAVIDALFELANSMSGNHQRFDKVAAAKKNGSPETSLDTAAT